MKKIILILILLVALSGCLQEGANRIQIKLNPGVDTVELGSIYIDPKATASYGIRVLEVTVISNTVDTEKMGVYEIVYEASYESYVKTIKRIVTVVDQTPPLLTLNPGIDTIFTDETWVDQGVTVFDFSQEDIMLVIEGNVLSNIGTYEITYSATDQSGNQSRITRVVSVIERP